MASLINTAAAGPSVISQSATSGENRVRFWDADLAGELRKHYGLDVGSPDGWQEAMLNDELLLTTDPGLKLVPNALDRIEWIECQPASPFASDCCSKPNSVNCSNGSTGTLRIES